MPVYKSGVEDSIKSSLLTTIGDIIGASAVSTPARIAAPASGQLFTGQGAGVLPAWAAATSAVVREGGNTVEATTTSVTVVDLLTAASLTIAVAEPFHAVAVMRKTSGAVADGLVGLTVNATATRSAVVFNASGYNRAEDGDWYVNSGPRATNYLSGGLFQLRNSQNTVLSSVATTSGGFPNAAITSLIVTGNVSNASITLGADELQVYSYAAS